MLTVFYNLLKCIYIFIFIRQVHNNFFVGTYYAAVMENRTDFFGRVVVDVGAGSGILSLFAAQVT
jgi:predicted RNA methylase